MPLSLYIFECKCNFRFDSCENIVKTAYKTGVATFTKQDLMATMGVITFTKQVHMATVGVTTFTEQDHTPTMGVTSFTKKDHTPTMGVTTFTKQDHMATMGIITFTKQDHLATKRESSRKCVNRYFYCLHLSSKILIRYKINRISWFCESFHLYLFRIKTMFCFLQTMLFIHEP